MVKKVKRYNFNPKLIKEIAQRKREHKNQLMNDIEQIMFKWDPSNFTVCPGCGVDDFCNIEGCKYENDDIISRLADYIISKEKETK